MFWVDSLTDSGASPVSLLLLARCAWVKTQIREDMFEYGLCLLVCRGENCKWYKRVRFGSTDHPPSPSNSGRSVAKSLKRFDQGH